MEDVNKCKRGGGVAPYTIENYPYKKQVHIGRRYAISMDVSGNGGDIPETLCLTKRKKLFT